MKFKFTSRKWVYVFWVRLDVPLLRYIPLPFAKVGISWNADSRASDIEFEIRERFGVPVKLQKVFAAKVFMWRGIEKAVHGVYGGFNVTVFKGTSGWTEYFWTVNVVFSLLSYIALWYFDIDAAWAWALLVMFSPVPFDLVLSVFLLAAFEYCLIGAAGWLLWCIGISLLTTI